MRRSGRLKIGSYLALIVACHATALGCGVPASGTSSAERGVGGKGDVRSDGGLSCRTSFDCPLDEMCNTAGRCVAPDEIADGEASPVFEEPSCDAHIGTEIEYRNRLLQAATQLYGEPGRDGSPGFDGLLIERVESWIERAQNALEVPNDGEGFADELERLFSARQTALAIAEEQASHEDLAEVTQVRVDDAVHLQRVEKRAGVLEALSDAHVLGFRVVERIDQGWNIHGEDGGSVSGLDDEGRASDGLYYVSIAEIDAFVAQPFRFEGTSRLGQLLAVIERDRSGLEPVLGSVLARTAILTVEGESGRSWQEWFESSEPGERKMIDPVERILEAYETVHRTILAEQEEFHQALSVQRWDEVEEFLEDHPLPRLVVLGGLPDLQAVDCHLQREANRRVGYTIGGIGLPIVVAGIAWLLSLPLTATVGMLVVAAGLLLGHEVGGAWSTTSEGLDGRHGSHLVDALLVRMHERGWTAHQVMELLLSAEPLCVTQALDDDGVAPERELEAAFSCRTG